MTTAALTRSAARATGRSARTLAAALIAYGVLGCVVVLALTLAVAPAMSTLDALARSSADVQGTLTTTRDAFDGFGTSLIEARRSSERAASTARTTAKTARQLGDAMGISIFGARPLLPIANGFQQQSSDLDALATELDALGTALARDETDVESLRDQVTALRDRAIVLSASAPETLPLAPILYALLAWLALQAIGAIWVGGALWKAASGKA